MPEEVRIPLTEQRRLARHFRRAAEVSGLRERFAKSFKETEHPRDSGGQFTEGGGGGGSVAEYEPTTVPPNDTTPGAELTDKQRTAVNPRWDSLDRDKSISMGQVLTPEEYDQLPVDMKAEIGLMDRPGVRERESPEARKWADELPKDQRMSIVDWYGKGYEWMREWQKSGIPEPDLTHYDPDNRNRWDSEFVEGHSYQEGDQLPDGSTVRRVVQHYEVTTDDGETSQVAANDYMTGPESIGKEYGRGTITNVVPSGQRLYLSGPRGQQRVDTRNETALLVHQRQVNQLEDFHAALESAPKFSGTVYRGLYHADMDVEGYAAKFKVGQTVTFPSATSTSKDAERAKTFQSSHTSKTLDDDYDEVPEGAGLMMKIQVSSAADIDTDHLNPEEQEVITKPGTKYRVVSNDGTNIELRQVA